MALKIRAARPASYASIFLELTATTVAGESQRVGRGTGFFVRLRGETYLITNWHVVTGRNPDDPNKQIYQTPDKLEFMVSRQETPNHFLPGEPIPLYDNGQPQWLQLPSEGERVDLVAIPLRMPEDCHVVAVNDFCMETETAFEPGREVVIVGFPFERSEEAPFPIWKKAMIATEPAYRTLGKRQCLLDTPGRSGMSGSPVYIVAKGAQMRGEVAKLYRKGTPLEFIRALTPADWEHMADGTYVFEFAGVYCGSYGDHNLDGLNLGRMLLRNLVDDLLEKGQFGENPFSPKAM